jgi:RNA-directed DNA polymerase
MPMQKSAEAIRGAGTGQRGEQERTRVGGGISMKPQKAEAHRQGGVQAEPSRQNLEGIAMRAEAQAANHLRTKAELERASGLMEAVCERGNLKLAYQRVVENKGAGGVDGIEVAEFKDHLKQHWPTIKAKLLAGSYMPSPVRRVDIAKPQGGVRTLGIPTLTDRLIKPSVASGALADL